MSVAITLFERVFEQDGQIQALVNLNKNNQRIKKITMSLYQIIEIKDQYNFEDDSQDTILDACTVIERIAEEVFDFREY